MVGFRGVARVEIWVSYRHLTDAKWLYPLLILTTALTPEAFCSFEIREYDLSKSTLRLALSSKESPGRRTTTLEERFYG